MGDIYAKIIGHDAIKHGLLHAVATKHLHHALLFMGQAGVGKSTMARAFVQSVFCELSTPDSLQCCGICHNCVRIAQNIHPDVITIEPDSATLKIELIRDLQKRLGLAPYESDRRFVIIKDVHKMQDAAANSLLKTLEEPDPFTSFILITSQPQRLLSTIISRCQVVRFASFERDVIADYLVRCEDVEPEIAQQTAILAGGSLGKALDLLQGTDQDELVVILDKILSMRSMDDAFATAGTLKGKKDKAEHLLLLLLTYMRDMALLKAAPNAPIVMTHYRQSMMRRLDKVSLKSIERATQIIVDVQEAFLGNVNEVVAWERLLMGLHTVVFDA